jgi:hypothetical protein
MELERYARSNDRASQAVGRFGSGCSIEERAIRLDPPIAELPGGGLCGLHYESLRIRSPSLRNCAGLGDI